MNHNCNKIIKIMNSKLFSLQSRFYNSKTSTLKISNKLKTKVARAIRNKIKML